MNSLEKLAEITKKAIENTEFKLVHTDVHSNHGKTQIRVYLDSERGITIDQCREFSRRIESVLDTDGMFGENYLLEVSSPGVDRPIKEDWQFRKNTGRPVKVSYRTADENLTEANGIIRRLEGPFVVLEATTGKKATSEVFVPIDKVVKATIQLKW